jgi:hypothetical protein
VSGHPRFNKLYERSVAFYSQLSEKLKIEFGPFILINLNCGFGNHVKGENFVRLNYGPRVKHLEKIISYDKFKFQQYIALVRGV